MLQVKYYLSLDMYFTFVAAFIYRYTGFQEVTPLTTAHTIYSDISGSLTTYQRVKEWIIQDFLNINADSIGLKNYMIETFHVTSYIYLYKLKFHLLKHVVKYLKRVVTHIGLDASPF